MYSTKINTFSERKTQYAILASKYWEDSKYKQEKIVRKYQNISWSVYLLTETLMKEENVSHQTITIYKAEFNTSRYRLIKKYIEINLNFASMN